MNQQDQQQFQQTVDSIGMNAGSVFICSDWQIDPQWIMGFTQVRPKCQLTVLQLNGIHCSKLQAVFRRSERVRVLRESDDISRIPI